MQQMPFDGGELIAIIAVAMGSIIAIVSIIVGGVQSAYKSRQREQSRREIAAYIAEGSMSAQEGERLMAAGEKPKKN